MSQNETVTWRTLVEQAEQAGSINREDEWFFNDGLVRSELGRLELHPIHPEVRWVSG
jgi:hypothetical protein